MSDANLDHTDLNAVAVGGLVNEDVMQKIWDISKIPLPFTNMVGTDEASNEYTEWTIDRLMDPDLSNALADGADAPAVVTNPAIADGAPLSDGEPSRVGNHCQISGKTVEVSTRSRNVDVIGRSDELSYQVMMRQRELRRDVEAIALTHQASLASDANVPTAGLAGGLGSWLATNGIGAIAAGFTAPGYNATTGLTVAPIVTTTGPLAESLVRDVCEGVYNEGGDPSIFMSIPTVVRKFSEYLFTSSARIATLTSNTGQGEGGLTAQGSVNVFVTDFGVVLELTPNRIMQPDVATGGSEEATGYVLDPAYLSMAYLHGYRTEPLAKTGLSDKRLMAVDWTLKVLNQRAHGAVFGIDYTADVLATPA